MESPIIVDVREHDEFKSEHVEKSIHLPLSRFNLQAPGIFSNLEEREIKLMCRSGTRAVLAAHQIEALGLGKNCRIEIFEGGILQWKAEGRPTVKGAGRSALPIMRQVQLVAGSLILAFVFLGFLVNPIWFVGAGFVGSGLTMAGATGFCLMAELLTIMPWNLPTSTKEPTEKSVDLKA